MAKSLVIGASGFLGSHVTRKLVERGQDVRVMIRKSSATIAFDDLTVERCYGDVFDDEALRAAMRGVDVVYYCVVDARAWLRDPAPLFRTNVEGLRHVLDAGLDAELTRFVFTSAIATLAVRDDAPVDEDTPLNWYDDGGPDTCSRVDAENLVLRYVDEHQLPAVALCISTTYGPRDHVPTPHGSLLEKVATGRFPFYFRNVGFEVVGIEDAADAMLLAAENGQPGERYIISERFISSKELHRQGPQLPVRRAVATADWCECFARIVIGKLDPATIVGESVTIDELPDAFVSIRPRDRIVTVTVQEPDQHFRAGPLAQITGVFAHALGASI